MSINRTYSDTRISNFRGGMDTLNSPSDIADGAFTMLRNFSTSGNRLVTMKSGLAYGFGIGEIRGITSYHEDIFFIQDGRICSWNYTDGSRSNPYGISLGVGASTKYTLTAFKFFGLYIVVCDANGVEPVQIFRFNKVGATWTFTPHVIVGLPTDSAFTCSKFFDGRLHLAGAPTTSGIVYWSSTFDNLSQAGAPDSFISFSNTGSGQRPIGESNSPIVGFAIRQDTFYGLTKSGVYKISNFTADVTTNPTTGAKTINSTNYQVDKETNTGVIGGYAYVEAEQDMFYFDGKSVRRLSYEANGNTFSVKDVSISSAMDNYIANQGVEEQSNAVMVFNYPYIYTFIRSRDTSIGNGNDVGIVYNVRDENWTTYNRELVNVGCSVFYKSMRGLVGTTTPNRQIVLLNETFGLNTAYASSKEYATFDDVDYKRYGQFEMSGEITFGTSVEIDVFIDKEFVQTFTITGGNMSTPTTGTVEAGVYQSGSALSETVSTKVGYNERFELYHPGRTFHYDVRKDGYGEFEIHSINFKWKSSPAYPSH